MHCPYALTRTALRTVSAGVFVDRTDLKAGRAGLHLLRLRILAQGKGRSCAMTAATKYAKEYEGAVKAVRLASKLCTKVQLTLLEADAVDKSDASPVTVADYGAQALVAWSLQRTFADQFFSMVAEEATNELREPEGAGMAKRITELVNEILVAEEKDGGLSTEQVLDLIDTGRSEGGAEGRHWVLDPIDGTRGFVGRRQYAVCLGLLDGGKVVVGVLGCPNLPQAELQDTDGESGAAQRGQEAGVGCIFAAEVGHGAFVGPLYSHELPQTRLQLADEFDAAKVRFMESYEAKHTNHGFSSRLAKKLGVTRAPLRIDSQTKYGALARGDAAINLRFPHAGYKEKIWDHCAGALIVQEAGAIISDASGKPLDFGEGRMLEDMDRGIVTATPKVHDALLKAINELQAEDA